MSTAIVVEQKHTHITRGLVLFKSLHENDTYEVIVHFSIISIHIVPVTTTRVVY